MKQITGLVLIITLVGAFKQSQAQTMPYTLKASFTGLKDGTVLELVPTATHRDEKPVATASVSKGKAAFSGRLAGPRLFRLKMKGSYDGMDIMLHKGNVTVSGDVKPVKVGSEERYDFTNVKVKGSEIHAIYLKKIEPKYALNREYEAYHKKAQDINDKVNRARTAKDSVQLDSLLNTAAWKAFEADETAFFKKMSGTMRGMIESNKDSWWGPFMMLNTMSYFTPNENKVFEQFSPAAKTSYYGKIVKEELFPEGFIGKQAPLAEMIANDGTGGTIKHVIQNKKYTLVDFWASWCVPCRKSIPALKQLYKDMEGQGFQILSISIDKKKADWLNAEKEEQLPWASYLDKGPTADAWKVRAIPAMYLLDENGVVIGQNLTVEEVRAKIAPKG